MAKVPLLARPIKAICITLFLIHSHPGWTQFVDNFSDNNFTTNPPWSGDVAKFGIDNSQLRLQAPAVAGTAYLSTQSSAINNAEWRFTLKLDFNPSSSNYARIYLTSDQPNVAGAQNGYFVMVGDTDDEVSLYRQAGSTTTKIIDGTNGTVNLAVVNIAVKVTRDNLGNWQLFSDPNITGTFQSEGGAFDNTFKASSYFGIYCVYTSTRADRFYFDDFFVTGDPYVDLDPPIVEVVNAISSNRLVVQFNEEVEAVSATSLANFEVANNIGHPASAVLLPGQRSVELSFLKNFQNGAMHLLVTSGIKDMAGNPMTLSNLAFLYFEAVPAKTKDIVISEIFADPTPQVGLPDAEFIEIFNRSNDPFNLAGWIFTDGSSTAKLPSKIMLPGDYLALTATSNVSKFGLTANVIGVSNFPTLNNSSDTLVIRTPGGLLIDSVGYDLSWYRDLDKQEGGWSLELIDPNNPCGEEENWTSSENEQGGTPGVVNSVNANKPDLTGPQLTSVAVLSTHKLLLFFNEKMENPISQNATFIFAPHLEVKRYYFESRALRSIVVELEGELAAKQLYTISAKNLFDCSGNEVDLSSSISFAMPEPASPGDIVINEILFNPRPNGVDFVELYNRSDKFINLKGWQVGNFTGDKITNPKSISAGNRIMAPNEYFVLTSNSLTLKNNYPQGKEDNFIQISMPSFPDDQGSAIIYYDNEVIIDQFTYEKQFHSPLIRDEEGVSLERISPFGDSNDKENWASTNSTAGFATPGFLNSNFRPKDVTAVGQITIDPPVFAPQSGRSDFSTISFKFDQPGFIANVKIFDQQGRLVKTIANNATLGFEGFFRWDGDLEDGGKARAGYYFIWFEVFNTSGTVKTFRERVIIAAR